MTPDSPPAEEAPTRVQPASPTSLQPPVPLAGGGGGEEPPPSPPLGGGDGGGGRDPRQNGLLIAAGVVLAGIAVVAVLLATNSSGSKVASATSIAATTLAPSTTTSSTVPAATVAPTTVATTSTTVAPTTTAVAPTTTTPTSPQQALAAITAKLGPVYAVSPIAGQDGSHYAAVDREAPQASGGSAVVVDIFQFVGGAWRAQASVPLGADGSTGLLLPASQGATPITISAVTGSANPDYVVTTASASSNITTIVSDQTGTWRAVPFQTPTGTVIGVPDATLQPTTITAVFNSCTPNCAQGAMRPVTFAYQGGTFVPVGG